MRLIPGRPSFRLLFCATLAAYLSADLALAKPQPMQGKRWRVDTLEKNKADEEYKAPPGFRDDRPGSDRTETPAYMPQADAFQTAAEQAVYLQAYQLYFGPYGTADQTPAGKQKRAALLKETSEAIEDCLKGVNCSDPDKQQKVLQALVQFNFGKDLKRISLEATTRRENMRSLGHEPGKEGDAQKIFESMRRGSSVSGGKRKDSQLSFSSGSARDPYYQLDRTKVEKPISPAELEMLGPRFVSDYHIFMKEYRRPTREGRGASRYYKYVEARPNTYVFAPGASSDAAPEEKDSARVDEILREQNAKPIQDLVDNHLKTLQGPQAKVSPTDQNKYVVQGEVGGTIGFFGQTLDVSAPPATSPAANSPGASPAAPGKPVAAAPPPPPITSRYQLYPIYADHVNKAFQKAAEKNQGNDADGRTPATSGASSLPGNAASPKDIANNVIADVTLSPDRFDAFLDEIWPSADRRKKIISGQP